MLRPGEDTDEPPEDELEAPLRVLWRQLRHRRWLADQQLQLGDELRDETCVLAECLAKRSAPARELPIALAEQQSNDALKRLRQRRIRDVALVLVELAGCEKAARRHERLPQLVHDRRLADAGVSG